MSYQLSRALFVLFFLCNGAFAAIEWTNSSGDREWDSGTNWSTGTVPSYISTDDTFVSLSDGPIVTASTAYSAAKSLDIVNTAGTAKVTMNGGYLNIFKELTVGDANNSGLLKVDAGGVSASALILDGDGTLELNSGQVFTESLAITNGTVWLNGGVLYLKTLSSDPQLLIENGSIVLGEGQLVLVGDHTGAGSVLQSYITAGKIVCADSSAELMAEFANGETHVFAKYLCVYRPVPGYGDPSADRQPQLTWGSWGNATAHAVYLHHNVTKVTSRDASTKVTDLSGAVRTYTPSASLGADMTYYWAVDVTRNGVVYPGPVWKFTTEGALPARDSTVGLQVAANGDIEKNGEPWRGFGITYHYLDRRDSKHWDGNPSTREAELGPCLDNLADHDIPYIRSWLHLNDMYRMDKVRFFAEADALVDMAKARGIALIPQIGIDPRVLVELAGEDISDLLSASSVSHQILRSYVKDLVVHYRDEPTIWGWELTGDVMNLADLPESDEGITREIMWSLYEAFADEVRLWDPDRMIECGETFPHLDAWHLWQEGKSIDDTPEQYEEIIAQDNADFDCVSIHVYPNKVDRLTRSIMAARILGKPAYLGEFGGDEEHDEEFFKVLEEMKLNDTLFGTLFAYCSGSTSSVDYISLTLNQERLDILQDLNTYCAEAASFICPFHCETEVPAASSLSWVGGASATAHRLYLSTNETDVVNRAASAFVGQLSTTTYSLAGTDPATWYYWAVDEVTPNGTVSGYVRTFRTEGLFECYDVTDNYVYNQAPTTVYDEDGAVLRIREASFNKFRGYLKVDVSGIGSKTVNQVQLAVRSESLDGELAVYAVSNNWQDSTLCWENAPAIPATPLATASATTNEWFEFDLSGHVTADGTYSFALLSTSAAQQNGFLFSFENDVTNKPYLAVSYTPE